MLLLFYHVYAIIKSMSTLPIVQLRRRQEFWQKSQETARELRREAHTIDPERPQRGIGRAAHNLLQLMQQVEHPTAETNQQQEFYKLYGTYRNWIAAVTTEKAARDSNRRLSPKNREKVVGLYSSFNDSLREIFNRWGTTITPADTMQLLNNFIPIADKPYYRELMENHIKGVRTELLAELALENMGFTVTRATTEQDKKGIDYLITDSQGEQTAIDIKSSKTGADETNAQNNLHDNSTIAVCPFSPRTLKSIHTILPADPYGQMLGPSKEMLVNLYASGVVDKGEYDRIKYKLDEQIAAMHNRNNNPTHRGKKLTHV